MGDWLDGSVLGWIAGLMVYGQIVDGPVVAGCVLTWVAVQMSVLG